MGRSPAKPKSRARNRKTSPASPTAAPRRREVVGVVLLALGVALLLAVFSYTPADAAGLSRPGAVKNLIGPVGHHAAEGVLLAIGLGALVVGLALSMVALAMFARRAVHLTVVEALGWVGLVLAGAVLAHLALPEARPFHQAPGGVVGLLGGEVLREQLNTVGAVIAAVATFLLFLMLATDLTVGRLLGGAGRASTLLFRSLGAGLAAAWARHREARGHRAAVRAERRAERQALREAQREADDRGIFVVESEEVPAGAPEPPAPPPPPPPRPAPRPQAPRAPAGGAAPAIDPRDEVEAIADVVPVDPFADPTHADPDWAAGLAALRAAEAQTLPVRELAQQVLAAPPAPPVSQSAAPAEPAPEADAGEVLELEPPRRRRRRKPEPEAEAAPPPAAPSPPPEAEAETPAPPRRRRTPPAEIAPADDAPPEHRPREERLPAIVEAKAPPKHRRQEAFGFNQSGSTFKLPELDLLDPPPVERVEMDPESLHETARRLTQKLADFGIAGEVQKIRLGPVVTMYEFVPGPGVKISKIAALADDLAMAMEALRVRIVAPLPGKGAVGIEVPNRIRQTVHLREILEQDAFGAARSKLTLAMGKDVEGMPFLVDLAQMPHLLIAGTTGSGKSVSVNAMITSILFKSTPDEVKFLMVDPKWTELSLYDGIPHLLLPVVKDPAKAALALRWAVDEMERRYQALAEIGVRSLTGYNREVEKRKKAWEERQATREPPPPLETADGDFGAYEHLKRQHEEFFLADPPPPEKLPLIVIVIDELADLMMVASREVETYIARIAQKARAAGIHLMAATQRPSTDVLTGLIKVNFPARIGFRVASRHDSQTIINQPGSEKLLGKGDMLIIPPGQADPLRVHGAFVSDDEIKRVVAHLQSQGTPVYDESILQVRDEDGGGGGENDDDIKDAKWDEALSIMEGRDSISVSFLQRRLAIGYNRAARMIEQMEREGIVGPADGAKPREVLLGHI